MGKKSYLVQNVLLFSNRSLYEIYYGRQYNAAGLCLCYTKKNLQEIEEFRRSQWDFATKIHCVTDALGNLLEFLITPRNSPYCTQFEAVLADKGYDSNSIVESIEKQGAESTTSTRRTRFNKLKHNFLGFLHFADALMLIRRKVYRV